MDLKCSWWPPGIPVSIVSPKEEEGGCNLQLFVCHANVWLKQMSWLKRHLHFMRPEEIHYTTATARKPLLLSLSLFLSLSLSLIPTLLVSLTLSLFCRPLSYSYFYLIFVCLTQSFLSILLFFFLSCHLTITCHLLPSLTFLNFEHLEKIKYIVARIYYRSSHATVPKSRNSHTGCVISEKHGQIRINTIWPYALYLMLYNVSFQIRP